MADDKKKEDKSREGKKKGLPAIVMIAIGAVVGGAGAVFAIPPKTIEIEKPAPIYEYVDVLHPDVTLVTFNAQARNGKGLSKIGFRFIYTVREDRRDEAFARLEARWAEVKSEALMLFKTRSAKELNSEVGMTLLAHDLIQTLDALLFSAPGGEHGEKPAEVTRIIWDEVLVQ